VFEHVGAGFQLARIDTRMKVSEPTNGSVMILNARPENGSLSIGRALDHASFADRPYAFDRRDIERRRQKSTTASSNRLHAFVFERRAVEHRHEFTGNATVPLRMHSLSSASVGSGAVAEIFFHHRIVHFDRVSTSAWRYSAACFLAYSAGISTSSNFAPSASSSQMTPSS
jgi:hypothetical protein